MLLPVPLSGHTACVALGASIVSWAFPSPFLVPSIVTHTTRLVAWNKAKMWILAEIGLNLVLYCGLHFSLCHDLGLLSFRSCLRKREND